MARFGSILPSMQAHRHSYGRSWLDMERHNRSHLRLIRPRSPLTFSSRTLRVYNGLCDAVRSNTLALTVLRRFPVSCAAQLPCHSESRGAGSASATFTFMVA